LRLEGRLQVNDTTAGCKRNCFEMSSLTTCSPFNNFCLTTAFCNISYESIISEWVFSTKSVAHFRVEAVFFCLFERHIMFG